MLDSFTMNELISQAMTELAKRSAKARLKKLGKKGLSEQMKRVRAVRSLKQKGGVIPS